MLRLLRRIARRCETHDRPSYPRIRDLETSLGLPLSAPPASLADARPRCEIAPGQGRRSPVFSVTGEPPVSEQW